VSEVVANRPEESMMKQFSVVMSAAGVAIAAAGLLAVTAAHPSAAFDTAKGSKSPTGFTVLRPVTKPLRLPLVTRDQLVTRGRADDKLEIADLFQAYMFFHDTHNGEGVASLFTPEGAMEHMWNNGGVIEPTGGPTGRGCFSEGRAAILDMYKDRPTPISFSAHSHNLVTNVSVQVYGDTATLYGHFTTIRSNEEGKPPIAPAPFTAVVHHNGEDVADLRRTAEGWRFVHLRVLEDEKTKGGAPSCEQAVIQAQTQSQ
jgi:SnoaL-like protein